MDSTLEVTFILKETNVARETVCEENVMRVTKKTPSDRSTIETYLHLLPVVSCLLHLRWHQFQV